MNSARTLRTAGNHRFLLVALPLLFVAGTGAVGGCDVECGDVLDIDGGQYRLTHDLVCPGPGPAVTITGEDVHFNLDGYTISPGPVLGQFLRRGIRVTGANAHINNGSIVDINCPAFGAPDCGAILLHEDAHGARINDMSLHNNTLGILAIEQASGARIHGNDITGNLRIGIGVFDAADDAKITDNDLSDTGGFTLPDGTLEGWGYLGSADDVAVIGNVANNCDRAGILLSSVVVGDPFAERNTIRDNTTLDNRNGGIILLGTTEANRPRDNLIQSNTSFGNGNWDLREGLYGLPMVDCVNTWIDNDFEKANPADCIE